jgi:hypothetical protein
MYCESCVVNVGVMKEKWIKLFLKFQEFSCLHHIQLSLRFTFGEIKTVHPSTQLCNGKEVLRLCKVKVDSRECVCVTEHFWSFSAANFRLYLNYFSFLS